MTAPKYLSRSWWADSDWPRGGAALVAADLWREGNVNHYPGRASAFGAISLSSLRSNLRGWWNYHVNTRGWSDIGYQVAVALTTDGPVVVDLRGIGRVPAAHASPSNPRANWHGGATLWVVGNTEQPDPELVDAYRHFRHTVWLPRWPTATKVTGHRLVPGTSTGCPGDPIVALIRSGALAKAPTEEDDMPTAKEIVDELFERRFNKLDPTSGSSPTMSVEYFLIYMHNYMVTVRAALTNPLVDSDGPTPRQAWSRAEKRSLAVLDLAKAQQPLIEAAAAGEALTAEAVQEIAASCAAAIPDNLVHDVVDELGERLSGETAEP